LRAQRPIAAAGSHPGREREINEDRVLVEPDRGIYAVVDGVGGESAGEVAAQLAVDVLRARLSRRTTEADRLVREAIALANKQIWEKAQVQPELAGMACVLTVAVLDGAQATIGHVGDSRLYLLGRGEIRKVTRDHSPVGMREDAGEISEAEAMSHPRRNEIFRDVGSAPHEPDEEGFIDIYHLPFDPESALLICSDGLSDMVPSAAIREVVESRAGDPDTAVRELIEAANAAGGKDNISVVIVEGARFGKGLPRQAVKLSSPDGLDSTQATARTRPQIRGAQATRESRVSRASLYLFFLLGVAVVLAGAWLMRDRLEPFLARIGIGGTDAPPASEALVVDPQGTTGYRTIREALQAAVPGQTVEVVPGEYLGPVELTDGVSLVSRVSRGAVIRLPQGTAEPAVTAEGVRDALLSGFRIQGNAQAPLEIGLRLADSALRVENLEISGAATAGIESAGTDQSQISESYIHDNPGTGVIVRDQAAPRLHQNFLLRNGAGPGEPRPGVEIRDAARPQLLQNRLEENAAAEVWVPALDRVDEVFGFNTFGTLPKERAVQTPPRPGETGRRNPRGQ
jgi:serine/threonine protein phosphatase PrpC